MGTSENDFDDFYHDDPIEKISPARSRNKFLTTAAVTLGSIFFFQSTFAGNISLNSGRGIEFGQSVSQAVACSGNTELTLTPSSTFINGSPGAHYLNSVTVSGIPDGCFGVDFTINAYGNSDNTPLALFNSTSTSAVVYDEAGTFSRGIGSTGMTVASSSGTFTATFTTPVAQSSSVFKLTIQSGTHAPRIYDVGDRGPGGGIVYYVSGNYFTSTGSTCGTSCKYLEVAPATWQSAGVSVADDSFYKWSNNTTVLTGQDITTPSTEGIAPNTYEKLNWKIGRGFYNTSVMKVSGATSAAQAAVLAYAGSATAGQWFIPSMNELNELCKYARGQTTGNLKVACTTGGTLKTGTANDLGGFVENYYWSSSESVASDAWIQLFGDGRQFSSNKLTTYYTVRPVRAF